MAQPRKTIPVDVLKDHVNGMLAKSVPEVKDGRIAMALVLEWALMETGNYHGFRFTDGDNGMSDDTRRSYY